MKRLFLTVGLGFALVGVNAQTASSQLVSSSGNSFSNASYQLDWSIGECLTATYTTGAYVLTQGFYQSSYTITSVENLWSDIEITVYPNPTTDFINLKVKGSKAKSMQYTTTDFLGKILQTSNIAGDIEQIDFSNYATGIYFISVSQNKQLIRSFRIIKSD